MLRNLALALLLLFVGALVAPAAAPVQVSYVVSDSMEPTIATNDGYVLVDAGTVSAGDIITYYSEERGTSVTHRVVDITEAGFVTQGDANPSTDQASGYPPVQPADVSGTVLTVDGDPLLIPNLGVGIALLRSYWYLTVALLAGLVLYRVAGSARQRDRDSVIRSREVILTTAVVAVVVGVALVSFAGTAQTTVYQVTEAETPGGQTLTVGAERTESLVVRTAKTPLTHVVTDTDGMTITDTTTIDEPTASTGDGDGGAIARLRARVLEPERQNMTASIPPQETTGPHRTSLRVSPYPATLPYGVVTTLHGIHPLLAALSTILVIVAPLYVLYWLLVDTMAPLRGTRSRRLRRLGKER